MLVFKCSVPPPQGLHRSCLVQGATEQSSAKSGSLCMSSLARLRRSETFQTHPQLEHPTPSARSRKRFVHQTTINICIHWLPWLLLFQDLPFKPQHIKQTTKKASAQPCLGNEPGPHGVQKNIAKPPLLARATQTCRE